MPRLALLALAVIPAALAAGCGGSSSDTATSTAAKPAAKPAGITAKDGKVTVASTEYAFEPATINAAAGKVAITLDNKGSVPHELVVLKTSAAPDSLKVSSDQRVSEKTSVGEVAEIEGGAKKTSTLDLKPGRYLYVCNIPTHYKDGMRGVLTVK